jgi:membrane fusion protein (multidrug efflux system)
MKSKLLIGLLIVLVLGGGLAAVKTLQIRKMIAAGALFAPPPETIASAVAAEDSWPDLLPAIGTVNAENGINLMAEIAGPVRERLFESGAEVVAGDLIAKLDTSSEEAQLRSAEAQSALAKITAERLRRLRAENAVAQSEVDQAESQLKQNEAAADSLQAIIAKKNIRAPFAGRLGIWQANLGQFLESGKPLIALTALSPLFVDFTLPQQDLSRLAVGLRVRATADAYPGQVFEGQLAAINPDLNATTRSVSLRAKFANAEKLLRPGMFVRVEVLMPQSKKVLAIPATAILSAPSGDSVFVITQPAENGGTNLVVQQKFIVTGAARGDFIAVETGLKAGDRVVSAGIFKLRNGMTVVENNEIVPKASLTPTPPNS